MDGASRTGSPRHVRVSANGGAGPNAARHRQPASLFPVQSLRSSRARVAIRLFSRSGRFFAVFEGGYGRTWHTRIPPVDTDVDTGLPLLRPSPSPLSALLRHGPVGLAPSTLDVNRCPPSAGRSRRPPASL